ncbi:hypothetical protein EGI20_10365 [Aquitalea sp. S1-19]|nr:hypothetical protein [Craterilacuibacter sinensis]MCP9759706.1 hypothetical protein [Aquitalea sp. S1-19]
MDYEVVGTGDRRLNNLALLVYAIQAISLFTGLPMLVGLVINYLKMPDVRGTLYESHFRWQIRTFWWMLLWTIVGGALTWILVGFAILGIAWLWFVYRIVRGFITLNDGKAILL